VNDPFSRRTPSEGGFTPADDSRDELRNSFTWVPHKLRASTHASTYVSFDGTAGLPVENGSGKTTTRGRAYTGTAYTAYIGGPAGGGGGDGVVSIA
jgi:hypothetical protein